MISSFTLNKKDQSIFDNFIAHNELNQQQAEQFFRYLELLCLHSERYNLTAVTDPGQIITRHFQDSLVLSHAVNCNDTLHMIDVGSGAGFPGIPLKIAFPALNMTLLEVVGKKLLFLQTVIDALNLQNITVCDLDWRTFLRKNSKHIDYVLARASLKVSELLRIFKPSSAHRTATVAYWASRHWQPEQEEHYVVHEYEYTIDKTARKLVFFSVHSARSTCPQDL